MPIQEQWYIAWTNMFGVFTNMICLDTGVWGAWVITDGGFPLRQSRTPEDIFGMNWYKIFVYYCYVPNIRFKFASFHCQFCEVFRALLFTYLKALLKFVKLNWETNTTHYWNTVNLIRILFQLIISFLGSFWFWLHSPNFLLMNCKTNTFKMVFQLE